jgi:hypothetical protein
MTENDFVPVNPSQSELLRYHLQVTNRVDKETEKRKLLKDLAKIENPPAHTVHQHAQISHDEQKQAINPNNVAVAKRVKKEGKIVEDEKEIARENPNFKHLSPTEAQASIKDMEKQVRDAGNRKSDLPPWNPGVATESKPAEQPTGAVVPKW